MKQIRMFLVITGLLLSLAALSNDKVVYGDDNRLDLFETTNGLHARLAHSTLAMIPNNNIRQAGNNTYEIMGRSLGSRIGLCEGEKFFNQPVSANCSAFLVTPRHIVTAGHCVENLEQCNQSKWVFDFNIPVEGRTEYKVPASSVYTCKKVVDRVLSNWSKDDYAFIELDREVTDREPLTVRTSGKLAVNDPLVVIGHPTGVPTKVAAGAIVRSNTHDKYFVTNLDTFGGNSGSAVFNSETGVVEGILVRGATDYRYDSDRGCRTPYYCTETGCRGEDVTRITNIQPLMDMLN